MSRIIRVKMKPGPPVETPASEKYPNEPVGFERIAENDMSAMEDNHEDAVLAGTWEPLGGSWGGDREIIQNAGVPLATSPHALRIEIPDGMSGGGSDMWHSQGWGPSAVDECYIAAYLRVNSPIERPLSETGRIVRLRMVSSSNKHNGNSSYIMNSVATPGGSASEFELSQALAIVTAGGSLSTGHTHGPNQSEAGTRPIKVDTWHLIEWWYKVNSLDGSSTVGDGEYKTWVDGLLHHHRTGIGGENMDDPAGTLDPGEIVAFRGWDDTRGFWDWRGDLVWTHGGMSDKDGDSFLDWGHIYISAPGS